MEVRFAAARAAAADRVVGDRGREGQDMKAQHKRDPRPCDRSPDDCLDALPADPDAQEFANGGGGYAALMSPPDRWLWIPAG